MIPRDPKEVKKMLNEIKKKGKWNSDIPEKTVHSYLYKLKFNRKESNLSVYYYETIHKISRFKRWLIKWLIGWKMELRK